MSDNSNGKVFTPTIAGLKNDGVDVRVYKIEKYTEPDPDTGEETTLWRKQSEKRTLNIRFTNAVMADLELEFESMDNWQQQISLRPYMVVLSTFVTLTGKSREQVSEMLDSTSNEEYQVALLLAWMIAMGADGNDLGKMLGSAAKLGRAKDTLIRGIVNQSDQVEAILAENYPGTDFSGLGSEPVEVSLPSGDIPPAKLSSSSEAPSQPAPAKTKKKIDL